MILTKTTYTDKELGKISKDWHDLKYAQFCGEEGDMVCIANTKKTAFRRFKELVRETDCKESADELDIDCVEEAYLFLMDKNNRNHDMIECDEDAWVVEFNKNNSSDFPVWLYRI